MSTTNLPNLRARFETVLDSLRRLEDLGSSSTGHAADIALVIAPLNAIVRQLMNELVPAVGTQSAELAGKPRNICGPSLIRRDIEIGLEALEGLQETAAMSESTAKAASRPMVVAIFQLEGAMNRLDNLIGSTQVATQEVLPA